MAKTTRVNEASRSQPPFSLATQADRFGSAPGIRRSIAALTLATFISCLGFSGCCGVVGRSGDAIGRFMEQQANCLRDRVWARRAFLMRYPHCDHENPRDFESGFNSGYADILQGGVGETPTLPPERYWSTRYSNEEGASRQTAWFAGFAMGSAAAQQDGTGAYYEIQISQELRDAMRTEKEANDHRRKVESANPENLLPAVEPLEEPLPGLESPMPQIIPGVNVPMDEADGVDQPMPLSFDVPVIHRSSTKSGQ